MQFVKSLRLVILAGREVNLTYEIFLSPWKLEKPDKHMCLQDAPLKCSNRNCLAEDLTSLNGLGITF